MLSAKRLGIDQKTLDALLWVREHLIDGSIKEEKEGQSATDSLNMRVTLAPASGSCGSVACIGGWMWLHVKLRDMKVDEPFNLINPSALRMGEGQTVEAFIFYQSGGLRRLFYPSIPIEKWPMITPAMAVKAIDNFLRTGRPNWRGVAKEAWNG